MTALTTHHAGFMSAALKAINDCDTMTNLAATRLERIVRSEPTPAHARYLAAVGADDYFAAWAAIMAAPDRAAVELEEGQRAALREAREASNVMRLALGEDPGGIGGTGWPLPLQVDPSLIISGDGSLNPLRRLATVKTIVGKSVTLVTAAQVTASYGAEGSGVGEVTPNPQGVEIKAERGTAFVRLTYELVDDMASAAAEIARLLRDAKDNLEAESFVTGTGTDEPEGILTGLSAFAGAPTDVADFTAAQEDLGARYQPNATWLMNIGGINAVDQLVAEADASNAKVVDGNGNLLRRPIEEVSFMPDGAVVYGDVRAGFAIVDRLGMSMEPTGASFDKDTGRPDGHRGFLAIFRSGSGVIDANALRLLGGGSE